MQPAKRACGRAVELEPTNAEYRLASELAQLSEAIETEEAARSRLQAAALAAVKQDPNLALAHLIQQAAGLQRRCAGFHDVIYNWMPVQYICRKRKPQGLFRGS